jgi:hypothetical protein
MFHPPADRVDDGHIAASAGLILCEHDEETCVVVVMVVVGARVSSLRCSV